MASLPVNAPGGAYSIHIEAGVLKSLGSLMTNSRSVIVTNPTLQALYGDALGSALPDATIALMLDGERYKTLNSVESLYSDFVAAGLDRSGAVIAFGGGVVGDTAGFAAASYMRGVDFIQVPTSLLAMVDSSVGGKVGVDLPQGKNLVGAFKQPSLVLIDPELLQTLPAREWRCGMAEVIKHGLLADADLLNPALYAPERAVELVERAVKVKIAVVERDPYEKGERAHLNLGHTFGHAIEQVTHYRWLHGEAVAVGLVAAARLSQSLGYADVALVEQVEALLAEVGLPTRAPGLDAESLYAAMGTDKKWISGQARFILLRGVGQPFIAKDVPKSAVIDVLKSLS
jgi:shikimate kinase/3-dehydroquinate synthase